MANKMNRKAIANEAVTDLVIKNRGYESKGPVRGETPEQAKEREAQNRRNLIASLEPDVAEFARKEFAELNLFQ